MRALKLLVVVMGIMIVVGFAVLIVTITGRLTNRAPNATAPVTASVPAAGGPSFTAAAIDLPQGARIEAMSTGPDRVVLDLALPSGERQLLVIDLATGKKLGMIPLHTQP